MLFSFTEVYNKLSYKTKKKNRLGKKFYTYRFVDYLVIYLFKFIIMFQWYKILCVEVELALTRIFVLKTK